MTVRLLVLLLCLLGLGSFAAHADDYPSRNIRIVVPFSAGGAVDILARIMAKNLTDKLGQTVYVENKPGASGNIGSELVAKAEPDGYTLLVSASTLIINPVVMAQPGPLDPLKDFSYVSLLARGPLLFIVYPGVANSVAEFVAKAKAHPEKYNMATGGLGGAGDMASEYFKVLAGLKIPVVLYKGTGPAFIDLIGGHVSAMLDPLSTSLPLAKSGKTKAIAVSSLKRLPQVPDVPTLDELGYKGFEFYTWYGLWAPKNLPPAILEKLATTIREIGNRPDMEKWFEGRGLQFSGISGQEFLDYSKADQAKQADIVKRAHMQKQ